MGVRARYVKEIIKDIVIAENLPPAKTQTGPGMPLLLRCVHRSRIVLFSAKDPIEKVDVNFAKMSL